MKIASSEIAMASNHAFMVQEQTAESLRMWRDAPGQSGGGGPAVTVTISDLARELCAGQAEAIAAPGDEYLLDLSDRDKQKIQLIQDLFYVLTGKRLKIVMPKKICLDQGQAALPPQAGSAASAAQAPSRVGWGLDYRYHHSYFEREQTTFAAAGTVKTADGREIRFDLAWAMSREYASETNISIRAGDALVDPLVINFAAPTASLDPAKFAFDLDADGDKEQISFVGQGSGFLTLDKNGDGVVNDGSELFGPASGNGFADLAAYDGDGNLWIDENDPIYSQLRIWTKDAAGQDRLLALGQAGVGAIYLGNLSTAFGYKDSANQLHGQLSRSGLFLRENGTAGTVQQVDLAV